MIATKVPPNPSKNLPKTNQVNELLKTVMPLPTEQIMRLKNPIFLDPHLKIRTQVRRERKTPDKVTIDIGKLAST